MKKTPLGFLKSLDKIATEIPVSKIMVKNIRTLKEKDSVQTAINIMSEHSISGLLITDEHNFPIGIVSEGDLIKKVFHHGKNPKTMTIKDIMSTHLFTIKPNLSIAETGVLMKKHGISKLPIVEDNTLIGYVTKADLLQEMNDLYYQNTRLKWFPTIMMVLMILIAILLVVIANKH